MCSIPSRSANRPARVLLPAPEMPTTEMRCTPRSLPRPSTALPSPILKIWPMNVRNVGHYLQDRRDHWGQERVALGPDPVGMLWTQLHIGIAHPEGQRERPVEAPATIAATSTLGTRPAATGAKSAPRRSRGKDEEKGLVHDCPQHNNCPLTRRQSAMSQLRRDVRPHPHSRL